MQHLRFYFPMAIGVIVVAMISMASASIAEELPRPESLIITSTEAGRITLDFRLPEVAHSRVRSQDGERDLLAIPGEEMTSREGWPDLPMVVRTLLIPPTGQASLTIGKIESRIETSFDPAPAPPSDKDDYLLASHSRSLRSVDGFWPPNPVEISEPAILRGHRLLSVRFYPIQHNPATGETRFNESASFSLAFSGSGSNEISNPAKLKPSRFAREIIDNVVLNPPPPGRDDVQSGSYLYIIPRVNGIDNVIQPLLDWRRRMGHRVVVARVNNNAQANTISDIIQDAYDSDDPVEFVALVGDAASSDIIVPPATQTGDYQYTRLDGNDPLPDVAIGRITVANLNQLESVVGKIVSYESDPFMEETDWFKRGAVVAGHQGNGLGEVLLAKWVRKELLEYGFDEVLKWYWTEDGEISGNQPFLTNSFRTGISIMHYRAYSHMNMLPLQVITNLPNTDGRWPAVLAISCNTGNFVADQNGDYRNIGMSEEFFRAEGGGIGAIGTATPNTNVRFNNLVAGGVWLGVYRFRQYCLGWGLVSGKYQIWRAYEGFDNGYLDFMDWNNLMGDPGTEIWTDVPIRLQVDHPATLPLGSTRFDVVVSNGDDEVVLPGAQVCLWKGEELHAVEITDDNGNARFAIPPDALSAGAMKLTVTKHNAQPYLADVNVTEPQTLLGVSGWRLDDDAEGASRGDGDGVAEAGETVEIIANLANLAANQVNGGVAVRPGETVFGELLIEGLELDQAPAPGESAEIVLPFRIQADCPDQEIARLPLDIVAGQTTWRAMIAFAVRSPKAAASRLIFDGEGIGRGEGRYLEIELRNIGGRRLEPFRARLTSLTDLAAVIDAEVDYGGIGVGGFGRPQGDSFRLRAHPYATPGAKIDLSLEVIDTTGYRQVIPIEFSLDAPGNRDPFGPDEYGYVCYDSGDTGWVDAPRYEWVEISGNGSRVNLNDQGDNQDVSAVVNIPFAFRYYGEEFNRITICSNGWAAFGTQAELANFRKQHIGQALCPNAMICPWWDNLIVPNNAGVFTRYDAQQGRFIIQWNNVQRLVEGGGGSRETFQIILYNQQAKPTRTGDGVVLFQYRDIDNQNAIAHNDLPYCAIGITDLEGLNGLEYTYWDTYPAGARPIADQMAIAFTTGSPFVVGVVEGFVTDAGTDQPLQGARVLTSNGFWGETDAEGFYRISDVIVRDECDLTASLEGYNDSTLVGFEIAEDETLHVSFSLLHPEFSLSNQRVDRNLPSGEAVEVQLDLSNQGNGHLIWGTSKRIRGGAEREPWDLIESLPVGNIVGDDRVEGVAFAAGRYFACGANGADPNAVYILDREGNLTGQWDQQGHSTYGMKDMEWDGEWLWGSGEDTVFAYTPDGAVAARFPAPYRPLQALAWDPESERFWVSGITTNIVAVTRDGRPTGQSIPRDLSWTIYGLAWNPEDPAGRNLYVLLRDRANNEIWRFIRIDPTERVPEVILEFQPAGGGRTAGTAISGSFDPLSWTLLAVANNSPQNGGDRIDAYYLQPRTDWFQLEPQLGILAAGEETELELTLEALELPAMRLDGELHFRHNADGGSYILPITMTVRLGAGAPDSRIWSLPSGWNCISLNITPEDPAIAEMFAPLAQDGSLIMLKDGAGRFYRPGQGFDNIREYNALNGYQMFLSRPVEFEIEGAVIAADEPISLNAGWSLISYLPRDPIPAPEALGSLGENLMLAKNGRGRFYFPEFGYSGMGEMVEGEGYFVKVREAGDLIYPDAARLAHSGLTTQSPVHFSEPDPGEANFSLLLIGDGDCAGWEAAAIGVDGAIAGAGRFDDGGFCGFPIWGASSGQPGLGEGNTIAIVLWDGVEERPFAGTIRSGELVWKKDGHAVAAVSGRSIPEAFVVASAYPNPFNADLRVNYGLPRQGEVRIEVYDLTGRLAETIFRGRRDAGMHSVVWNASSYSTGVYVLSVRFGSETIVRKVALVR